MNKKMDFILCLFLGYLGIHKFYEKKITMGILYLCTGGLFFIGWIYDCIKLGIDLYNSRTSLNNNYYTQQETPIKNDDSDPSPIIDNTITEVKMDEPQNKIDTPTTSTTTVVKKLSKRDELVNAMNPSPIWNEGTEAQQDFASDLVDKFCNRFAKYLCWGIKDHIISSDDADDIANSLFMSIDSIDDAKWWCNKKNTNDFAIATKLLEDNELIIDNIKKLKKEYL